MLHRPYSTSTLPPCCQLCFCSTGPTACQCCLHAVNYPSLFVLHRPYSSSRLSPCCQLCFCSTGPTACQCCLHAVNYPCLFVLHRPYSLSMLSPCCKLSMFVSAPQALQLIKAVSMLSIIHVCLCSTGSTAHQYCLHAVNYPCLFLLHRPYSSSRLSPCCSNSLLRRSSCSTRHSSGECPGLDHGQKLARDIRRRRFRLEQLALCHLVLVNRTVSCKYSLDDWQKTKQAWSIDVGLLEACQGFWP